VTCAWLKKERKRKHVQSTKEGYLHKEIRQEMECIWHSMIAVFSGGMMRENVMFIHSKVYIEVLQVAFVIMRTPGELNTKFE